MATMLTSADVAALVSAFPPPTPSKDKSSLVRSISGDSLISSQEVLSHFGSLLKSSQKRIKISELRNLLGIQAADWVVECYDDVVHLSRDRQSIVPYLQIQRIIEELHVNAAREFVSRDAYVAEKDISSDSGHRLSDGLHSIRDERGKEFVASESLVDETRTRIEKIIAESSGGRINLTTANPNIPLAILIELAKASSAAAGITFEVTNGDVICTPEGYRLPQADESQAAQEARIESLLQGLESNGFIEVLNTDTSVVEEVTSRYATKHSDEVEQQPEGTVLHLISTARLNQTLNEMKETLSQYHDTRPADQNSTLNRNLQSWLIEGRSNKTLAEFVVRSKYKRQVDNAWYKLAQERNRAHFDLVTKDDVVIPVHLYSQGLRMIQDPALRQRLDDYILDHCKKETLPQLSRTLFEKGLLRADKSRAKEFEKFKPASEAVRSLSDLEAVVASFAKKCKITPPSPEELAKGKKDILNQKLHAMGKMTRASDVLQNTIWILLAAKTDGLFMSPGKDTSKMIKQYQLVGDDQIVKQLEEWRDRLKQGEESGAMVKSMQHLASTTVFGSSATD